MPAAPQEIHTREEVLAGVRSAVGVGESAAGLGLPDAQRHVMNAGYEQVRANDGAKALEAIAAAETGFIHGGWEEVLEAQVFSGFDADGKRMPRTPVEQTKFNEAKDAMELFIDYMEHGYDNLSGTPAARLSKQQRLRSQMRGFLESNAVFRDALGQPTPPHNISDATLAENLRDESIQRKLAAGLNALFDPSTLTKLGEGEGATGGLHDARATHAKAALEKTQLMVEKAEEEARKTDAETQKTQFETNATYAIQSLVHPVAVTKQNAIDIINGQLVTAGAAPTRNLQSNLERAAYWRGVRDNATAAERTAADAKLTAVDTLINTALGDAVFGQRCQELKELFDRKQKIEGDIASTKANIKRLDLAIVEKDTAVIKGQASYELSGDKRGAESGDFAHKVVRSFTEAAKQQVAKNAREFIKEYRPTRDAAVADAAKENVRQVEEYIQGRWMRFRPRSFLHQWRERLDVNKGQARSDFALFMGRGPDAVIEDVLVRAGIPDAQRALMLQDESEKGFMEKMRTEVGGKILAAYTVAGGKLKKRHLDVIALSGYGKDAVTKMKAADTASQKSKESAVEAGYTKPVPSDLYERMMSAPKTVPGKFILGTLLFPMRLLRPGAIFMGRRFGTIDVV